MVQKKIELKGERMKEMNMDERDDREGEWGVER